MFLSTPRFISSYRRLEMNSGDHAAEVLVKMAEYTAAVVTVIFQSLIAAKKCQYNHALPNACRCRLLAAERRGNCPSLPNNVLWNCCGSITSPTKSFQVVCLLCACMHTRARTRSAQFLSLNISDSLLQRRRVIYMFTGHLIHFVVKITEL